MYETKYRPDVRHIFLCSLKSFLLTSEFVSESFFNDLWEAGIKAVIQVLDVFPDLLQVILLCLAEHFNSLLHCVFDQTRPR